MKKNNSVTPVVSWPLHYDILVSLCLSFSFPFSFSFLSFPFLPSFFLAGGGGPGPPPPLDPRLCLWTVPNVRKAVSGNSFSRLSPLMFSCLKYVWYSSNYIQFDQI